MYASPIQITLTSGCILVILFSVTWMINLIYLEGAVCWVRQINNVLFSFRNLNCVTKMQLHITYCFSFYMDMFYGFSV